MDEDFDTGPILAQATFPIEDDDDRSAIRGRSFPVMAGMLPRVFERIASGDPGDPQGEGSYNPLFDEEFAWIDASRPAREVHTRCARGGSDSARARAGRSSSSTATVCAC